MSPTINLTQFRSTVVYHPLGIPEFSGDS